MRATERVHAESVWILRRWALRAGAITGVAIASAIAIGRLFGSSADVDKAIQSAEEIARAASTGAVEVPVAAAYVEPRYILQIDLPFDIAAVGIVLGLVGLVAGAMLIGGEWRTGSIALAFRSPRDRVAAIIARVLSWSAAWTVVSVFVLTVATVALVAVGVASGDPHGLEVSTATGFVFRAVAVSTTCAFIGAGLAAAARSDVVVVVATLAFVLVTEIAMPLLVQGGEFRSPGTRIAQFVGSRVTGTETLEDCAAPRCDPLLMSRAATRGCG